MLTVSLIAENKYNLSNGHNQYTKTDAVLSL